MFGLSVKIKNVGTLEQEWQTLTEHQVKSKAGHLFHNDAVESVCVFNEQGEVPLYLKKTPNGVYREIR